MQTLLNQIYEYFLSQPANFITISLRTVVLVCIIIFSYLLAEKVMAFISVRVKKGNERLRPDKNLSGKAREPCRQYKFRLLKFIDGILDKRGRPLGLNAVRYLAVKGCMGPLAVIPTVLLNTDVFMSVIFFTVGFFTLDILLVLDNMDNNKRIEKDMPNIINNLYMQMEANIPFKQCLETLHLSSVHSRLLKNCLKELQLRFLIKDHDIVAVCDDIENKLDNISFSVLLMAFRQYKDSGKMKDILRRQNELHMKKEEELIERESRAVIKLAAASTVLIAVNCILMLVYPMFLTMSEKMQILLK